jgi:dihydroorotate dehydrogenase electron transfer subunit
MQLENAKVLKNEARKGGYYLLELDAPQTVPQVMPGQFVHLRIPDRSDLVLRRPFSIFRAANSVLSVLYKNVGQGTDYLSRVAKGTALSILGPLGNGFPAPQQDKTPVLLGGGYGMAALYLVAERSPVKGMVLAGGASGQDILCAPDFEALGWDVRLATEDGTVGIQGLITALLDEALRDAASTPELFVCGPMGMLKAMGRFAQEHDLTAWLSLDHYMACGVGACLACVQKIRRDGVEKLMQTCKEGPVFECREIVWEDKA